MGVSDELYALPGCAAAARGTVSTKRAFLSIEWIQGCKKNKLCINFQHMQENAENVPSIFIQMNLRFFRFLCNK